jgi:hypothetical protein
VPSSAPVATQLLASLRLQLACRTNDGLERSYPEVLQNAACVHPTRQDDCKGEGGAAVGGGALAEVLDKREKGVGPEKSQALRRSVKHPLWTLCTFVTFISHHSHDRDAPKGIYTSHKWSAAPIPLVYRVKQSSCGWNWHYTRFATQLRPRQHEVRSYRPFMQYTR